MFIVYDLSPLPEYKLLEGRSGLVLFVHSFFFFNFYLFIFLFIYGCVGSSFLCEGFL